MAEAHPTAIHHLPSFITAPGETDVLMVVTTVILAIAVLGFGILFLRLHTLPERIAHRSHKLQFEIVAVLGLIALFTHMHIFWIASLLLALIDLPDFGSSLSRIAGSAEKMAGLKPGEGMVDIPPAGRADIKPPDRTAEAQRDGDGKKGDAAVMPSEVEMFRPTERSRSMLELLLCSLLTILPDYLYRRYVQGKRFGKEITFYSVWFELRWGITSCLMLTVCLITIIFYNHPSTTSVTLFFRTVPIISETTGRVAEVYVGFSGQVAQGAPIFRLDSSKQEAAVESARRKIAEVVAETAAANADLAKAEGQIQEAEAAHKQTTDELEVKRELNRRQPGMVAFRDIERLEVQAEGRLGSIIAANAVKKSVEERIAQVLPAQKASAEAAMAEAQVDLDKTVIRAGVSGRVEQFALRVGDIVTPIMRSAGVLIPDGAGKRSMQAGFGQIEAQIMKVGMIAEVTCVSRPWTVIPMVVTEVQDYIAAGQFRGGEQLVDPQQVTRPGTLLAFLEPLYQGGLDGVTPGSSCIANAYSSNHDIIASEKTGAVKGAALHAVDALGLVHALILRLQALLLPFKTLVFSGH